MQTTHIRYDEAEWRPRPTLTGADYTSTAVYDEEREKVWWGDWVCLGRTEELPNPGDYIVRDLTGESVFIVRNEQGELHGFYNVCSHRGTKFLDDEPAAGNVRKAFVCPYHAWAYDLNGRLIGSPNVKEGELFDRGDYPLHGFAVETYGGFIFASLAKEPRPFMEFLNEGAESVTMFDRFKLDELRVGVRIVYEVAANWKIVVENYNECLHCPQVHAELVQVVPLFRFGEVWDEETRDDGNWMREGATSFTMSGESELPKFPDLAARGLLDVLRRVPVPEPAVEPAPGLRHVLHRLSEGARSHHGRVRVPLPARDDRGPLVVQAGAGRGALGPDLEAGLGDLPARADRRRVARVHHRGLPPAGPVPVRLQRAVSQGDGPSAPRLMRR